MLEAEIVHHRGQHDDDPDLHDTIQADLEAVDFFWFGGAERSRQPSSYSLHFRDWNA